MGVRQESATQLTRIDAVNRSKIYSLEHRLRLANAKNDKLKIELSMAQSDIRKQKELLKNSEMIRYNSEECYQRCLEEQKYLIKGLQQDLRLS